MRHGRNEQWTIHVDIELWQTLSSSVIDGPWMQMHVKFAHGQACVEEALGEVESCLMSQTPTSASQ